MATKRYIASRKKWLVRWQVKNKYTGEVNKGSETYDTEALADGALERLDVWLKDWKLKRDANIASTDLIQTEFAAYCGRYTQRTRGEYKSRIAQFFKFVKPKSVELITRQSVNSYINHLLTTVKGRTTNNHITTLRTFGRFLAETYEIPNPAAGISDVREEPPDQRFLTHEEYTKVLSICKPYEKRRIMFIANTGLRATEFCELKWSAIAPDGKTLTLTGKGRKRRTVPLNKIARTILDELPKRNSRIYLSESKGLPFDRRALNHMCSSLAVRAGIPLFGPHALRHYFATELIVRGVPIYKVSKLLGHASVRLTEKIYIHFIDSIHLIGSTDVLES